MTAETITTNDDIKALSDRELIERICRQLYHLDTMVHESHQITTELQPLVPLIPRALALLDPAARLRTFTSRKGRADAVPKSAAAPVHVGEASADSGPVGA